MRVLLTGALGFIGKNFLIHRPKNWQIFALDVKEDKNFQKNIQNTQFFKIDLTDEAKVKQLASKMPHFDVCLYLAANGDPALSVSNPAWDLKATTLTLINTCRYFKIKKFVYLSSGAVYDGSIGQVTPKTSIDPTLPYAISHLSAERYTRFFYKDEQYVVIRFFGAYGPYEPARKIYSNLVRAFDCHSDPALAGEESADNLANARSRTSREILRLTTQDDIEKKKEFVIRGNGRNLIDAMYIEDAIEGFVKVILSKKTNLTVDFCRGDHPTVNALVKSSAKIFGINVTIQHEGMVPEYNRFYASPKEFQKYFHFKPEISLEDGMKRLKEHLETNYSN